MAVRTAYVPTAGTAITAANHVKFPGGWIGYAEVTADQSSITSETDLTSLTVTVTVGTSRRIKVSAEINFTRTVSDGVTILRIKEGAVGLQRHDSAYLVGLAPLHCEAVLTPSSGSHTYNLTLERGTGTGTTALVASGGFPAFILVEDIGPAA